MISEKKLQKEIYTAKEKYGNCLYHYTTITALEGMIKNKEFWFSNARNMNDKSELRDFVDRICNAVLENENNSFACETVNKIKIRVQEQYPFVMSLSYSKENAEDAAMWERYADNAKGICIKFDLETFYRTFFGGDYVIDQIFYQYNEHDHELIKMILKYIKKQEYAFPSLEGMISNIASCASFHKHNSFLSEKEIRLTYLESSDLRAEYILNKGIIKSIIKVPVEKLCRKNNIKYEELFKEIIIGPRSLQNRIDLKEFLKANDFNILAEHIEESKCPLR